MDDGLPGSRLVRGAMIVLGLAFIVGIYFLVAPPTLPHEEERTGGAPPPARATPAAPPVAPAAPAATTQPDDATPTAVASPQPARSHTIQPGDTLLAIAERYDTTVDAIRAANPGLSETELQIGQEIVIPPSQ